MTLLIVDRLFLVLIKNLNWEGMRCTFCNLQLVTCNLTLRTVGAGSKTHSEMEASSIQKLRNSTSAEVVREVSAVDLQLTWKKQNLSFGDILYCGGVPKVSLARKGHLQGI